MVLSVLSLSANMLLQTLIIRILLLMCHMEVLWELLGSINLLLILLKTIIICCKYIVQYHGIEFGWVVDLLCHVLCYYSAVLYIYLESTV